MYYSTQKALKHLQHSLPGASDCSRQKVKGERIMKKEGTDYTATSYWLQVSHTCCWFMKLSSKTPSFLSKRLANSNENICLWLQVWVFAFGLTLFPGMKTSAKIRALWRRRSNSPLSFLVLARRLGFRMNWHCISRGSSSRRKGSWRLEGLVESFDNSARSAVSRRWLILIP